MYFVNEVGFEVVDARNRTRDASANRRRRRFDFGDVGDDVEWRFCGWIGVCFDGGCWCW